MIYTPRVAIDMLLHPAMKAQQNPAACTKIEFKGYEISIAMDSSHGTGDLRRSDIRIYTAAGRNVDVTSEFLQPGEYMLYGHADILLRVMKQIEAKD